jgi:hypothetical protein
MPLTLLTVCLWPIQAPIKPNRTSLTPLSGENRVGNRSRYIGSLRSSGFYTALAEWNCGRDLF